MDARRLKYKLRVRHMALYEDFSYFLGQTLGRGLHLFRLLTQSRQYVFGTTYFPEARLKTKSRIFLDQLSSILKHGELNQYYFLYGLDRVESPANEFVPEKKFGYAKDMLNYLPPDRFSRYNFLCLLQNKFVFGAFCKGAGIPTPEIFALVSDGRVTTTKGQEPAPIQSLMAFDLDVFCKPTTGSQGKGTFHLKIVRNTKILRNGKEISPGELNEFLQSGQWILQERISAQHPALSALNSSSVNTIRIVSVQDGDDIQLLGAGLRMGIKGSVIDNWSSGGIIAPIDLDKGELMKWGFFKPQFGTKMDSHPDSGITFEGYKVPLFDEVKKLIKSAHRLFFGIHSIGWDVAVTVDGPVLVEGNDDWDHPLYQALKEGAKLDYERFFVARLKSQMKPARAKAGRVSPKEVYAGSNIVK